MFLSGAKTLSQSYMKSGESCPFCPRIEFWRGTGLDSWGFAAKAIDSQLRSGRKVLIVKYMAEREGFEPPIALRLCLISSQVHSTGLCHLSALF
jgi:hypothetical protein